MWQGFWHSSKLEEATSTLTDNDIGGSGHVALPIKYCRYADQGCLCAIHYQKPDGLTGMRKMMGKPGSFRLLTFFSIVWPTGQAHRSENWKLRLS
jgi:hypothetical protein